MRNYYFKSRGKSTNVRVNGLGRSATHGVLTFLWRWAPRLTRWLALRLFFSPTAYHIKAEEKTCLDRGRPFQIQVHDKIVNAWQWGQGPAVLLVHGWGGRGSQFYRFVEPLVDAGYTAIAIDMPAHGASTGRITSYFEFTDTLRAFLSKDLALGVQGIVAHSFGASATINALVKEDIGLNTVCIAPIFRLRELLFNTFARFGIPSAIYMTLIGEFEMRFGYNFEADNPLALLPDLRSQVLVVHDENDRTAPFRDSAEQAQHFTHITLKATKGLGHRRLLADPAVVQTCLEYISQQETKPVTNLVAGRGV